MTTETKHTTSYYLPWNSKTLIPDRPNGYERTTIKNAQGDVVATIKHDRGYTSSFIVRCVNSHDALVEALKNMVEIIDYQRSTERWNIEKDSQRDKEIRAAKKALASAGVKVGA